MSAAQPSAKDSLDAFQKLRIRVLWVVVALIALMVLFTQSVWEGRYVESFDLHGLIEIVGIALISVAVLGRAWATLYIGGRKSSEVVTTGPYSVTRNPLYLFSVIGAAGAGAQTGSVIVVLVSIAAALGVFAITIRQEEAFLSETFGAPYTDYLARVPRLWPKFSLYREGGDLIVYPRRLFQTLRDSSLLLLAFPAFETIELLQEAGILPVLAHLW
jgi:protein-S-isoprenylcysteine O-methyltransferase Ste14